MALIRLKRPLDEDPVDTLLIAYKKKKEDTNLTSVFKFATTLLDEKEDVFQHMPNVVNLVDSKKLYKQQHITNITDKLRKENKLFSQNSRLKLVNCLRESFGSNDVEGCVNSEVTLLDIESNPLRKESQNSDFESTSNAEIKDLEMTKYVYDIYYAPNTLNAIELTTIDSEISCHVIDTEMAFECYRDDAYGEEEMPEDEDDSNDENNWRNDYPDEDEDSIGEEDMRFAAAYSGLTLDDNYDLSSDEQDEALVDGINICPKETAMFGKEYSRYKKRILNNHSDDSDCLSNDEDDRGHISYVDYGTDDDDGDYYCKHYSSSESEKSNDF